ncbi:MAG: alpha/beta hydrolase [Nocardiopsis sp. BM-2018]|uniref:Pimeloyl-ACP methyl ester carboxylesterase n=1 Tax=Nocardiopsis metallicus TaxID=179819 RepID=A0A840W163_9ACTN|nr:alpha/beta hydrolase [Nocardiopsis metallicus]MBB5489714.1 pimeloyl-ACP methyl ester carboxylesterase [Nocardiopsis metallicus]QRN79724.1 MAG: alpha/beta hydrolase [Nocardiopsis sp. BM-2018]
MTRLRVGASGGLSFDTYVEGPENGPTVLLLHGFPHHHRSWDDVVPELVRAGVRTVTFDQRGYGDGARPRDVSAYALPLLAADALEVLDALGADSAHVVGHDWGAAVAWYLAARHPDRVRSLTAVAIPHLDAYQDAYRDDPEQRAGSKYVEFLMAKDTADVFLADDGAQLQAWFRQAGDVLTEEQISRYVTWHSRPGVLDAALNWYRANNLLGERFDLGPVAVPSTLVWSRTDPAVSTTAAERTAEYVTGPYRLVTLEKTSHWQPQQAPGTVSEEILGRVRG